MRNKIFILTTSLLLLSGISIGQGTWTQKKNYADNVSGAVGFSIGNKGYIGLGWNPYLTNVFWEYNPSADQWVQKINFPGTSMGHSVGFTINDKGYIGTGLSGPGNTFHNQFWQYDSLGDSWTQKSNFGGVPRSEATGFSLNGKGYIGTGWNQTDGFRKDFWEYNPTNDQWIQKANFPGTSRVGAVGFSINGKGYIGLGSDSSGVKNDLWEYNPSTDSWLQKSNFPSPRSRAEAFVINDVCYLGTGFSASARLNDFWRYDSSNDTWSQIQSVGTLMRQASVAFTINNKGYIGTGADAGAPYYNDFWEYTPDTVTTGITNIKFETSVSISPNPFSSQTTLQTDQLLKSATLTVYNSFGQLVKHIKNISGQTLILHRDNLSRGLYFIQLTQDSKVIKADKLIITD